MGELKHNMLLYAPLSSCSSCLINTGITKEKLVVLKITVIIKLFAAVLQFHVMKAFHLAWRYNGDFSMVFASAWEKLSLSIAHVVT